MWTILPTPGFSIEWRKKVFREVIDTEGPTYRQAGTFRMRFARLGWVSEEASSAQPFRSLLHKFQGETRVQDHGGSTLIALNEGLMKPRKGSTPVMGKKNWGLGSA